MLYQTCIFPTLTQGVQNISKKTSGTWCNTTVLSWDLLLSSSESLDMGFPSMGLGLRVKPACDSIDSNVGPSQAMASCRSSVSFQECKNHLPGCAQMDLGLGSQSKTHPFKA
jgi:hypothetical protein